MTDRELLELAAKEAGYTCVWGQPGGVLWWRIDPDTARIWNPLADDGDALRLAVKLGLKLNVCVTSGAAQVGGIGTFVEIDFDADPYAATRRAIVRAAAKMYKET